MIHVHFFFFFFDNNEKWTGVSVEIECIFEIPSKFYNHWSANIWCVSYCYSFDDYNHVNGISVRETKVCEKHAKFPNESLNEGNIILYKQKKCILNKFSCEFMPNWSIRPPITNFFDLYSLLFLSFEIVSQSFSSLKLCQLYSCYHCHHHLSYAWIYHLTIRKMEEWREKKPNNDKWKKKMKWIEMNVYNLKMSFFILFSTAQVNQSVELIRR